MRRYRPTRSRACASKRSTASSDATNRLAGPASLEVRAQPLPSLGSADPSRHLVDRSKFAARPT